MPEGKNICFFDIETQYLFEEIEPHWNSMTWKEKSKLKDKLSRKLKLAVAGLLINNQPIRFFDETEVNDLFSALESTDIIVGHNLLNFDYIVLSRYFSENQIESLVSKTIDTLSEIDKISGVWTKLDDLGELNFGINKLENTKDVPKLWRNGEYERVKIYLRRDIEIQKKVYLLGKEEGQMKYLHKEYGKIKGVRLVEVNW